MYQCHLSAPILFFLENVGLWVMVVKLAEAAWRARDMFSTRSKVLRFWKQPLSFRCIVSSPDPVKSQFMILSEKFHKPGGRGLKTAWLVFIITWYRGKPPYWRLHNNTTHQITLAETFARDWWKGQCKRSTIASPYHPHAHHTTPH